MKQALVWAFLVSMVGCGHTGGGTETDNPASPLKDFSSSGCKNRAPTSGQQALILKSDADGLQCVEWERNASGTLTLRLLNFPEPCGDTYLGKASIASDSVLEVTAFKDTCAVAKCGLCLFDFSYELASIAEDQPLELRVGSAACDTEPATFMPEMILPTDEQSGGIFCRYLPQNAVTWYATERNSCGQRNMPCGDGCTSDDKTVCGDGSSCEEVQPGDARCLQDCATNDDCAGGLSGCVDGHCYANMDL